MSFPANNALVKASSDRWFPARYWTWNRDQPRSVRSGIWNLGIWNSCDQYWSRVTNIGGVRDSDRRLVAYHIYFHGHPWQTDDIVRVHGRQAQKVWAPGLEPGTSVTDWATSDPTKYLGDWSLTSIECTNIHKLYGIMYTCMLSPVCFPSDWSHSHLRVFLHFTFWVQ